MIRGRVCVVCANACTGSNDTSDETDSGGRAEGERYGISKGANLLMSGMCMVSLYVWVNDNESDGGDRRVNG